MSLCWCRDWYGMLRNIYGGGYRLGIPPHDRGTIYYACNIGRMMGSALDPAQPGYAVGAKAGKKEVAIFPTPEHVPGRWWAELEHRDGHGLRYTHPIANPDLMIFWSHLVWMGLLWGGLTPPGSGAPYHHGQHHRVQAQYRRNELRAGPPVQRRLAPPVPD